MRGIDISHWNGCIDFSKVKAAGYDFVIIKAGGSDKGFYKDSKFLGNYKSAVAAGLHVGAYYFVGRGCTSYADGLADAERFYNIIKGMKFDMPVYIDFEAPEISTRTGNTEACIAFCEYMEQLRYYVGIYASDISGFKDRLCVGNLTSFDKWVARYGNEPKYVRKFGMWQQSSSGQVPGIDGRTDIDISYKDYPSIIKKAHLNGY